MAVRVGKYRVGFNSRSNAFYIIMNIVMLILWFYVGNQIITIVRTLVIDSTTLAIPETNIFYNGFQLLGLVHATTSSGLVGIIGLLLAVGVLMQAIRITRV